MVINTSNKYHIITTIKDYIDHNGGRYPMWYVGITLDPDNRVFIQHNVDRDKGLWICMRASSNLIARGIERYFLDVLGTDGGTGGGDVNTVYVYAYRKTVFTNP